MRVSADGGTRTRTTLSGQRILSPLRLPFRHIGPCQQARNGPPFCKYKKGAPTEPVRLPEAFQQRMDSPVWAKEHWRRI
jgi:hypothetical protein